MDGLRRVGVSSYRRYRLKLFERPDEGWVVAIHDPSGGLRVVLKNRVPDGLEPLLEEARTQVDRWTGRLCQPGW